MKSIVVAMVFVLAASVSAEQYRLKFPASVDVLDETGKVVSTTRLKAGTVISLAEGVVIEEGKGESSVKETATKVKAKLVPSDISPEMWKNKRPAHAVLRAELELDTYYNYSWRDKQKTHWSVRIAAKNEDWSYGESITGYVLKSSSVGKRIAEALKDGKEHRALVKVKPTKFDDEVNFAVIEDFELVDGE